LSSKSHGASEHPPSSILGRVYFLFRRFVRLRMEENMHQEPAEAFLTVIQRKYSFIGRRSTNALLSAKCIRSYRCKLLTTCESSVVRFDRLIELARLRLAITYCASLSEQWEKSSSRLLAGDSHLPTFPGFTNARLRSDNSDTSARISMHCTHWHRLANPGAFSTSLLVYAVRRG